MSRGRRELCFLIGGICALVLNFEPLLLGGNDNVRGTYTSVTFDLDYFLNKRQFLVSVKQLFVIFVFCFLYGMVIKNKYTIYTFLRLEKKKLWLFGQFLRLWGDAVLFFGIYGVVTLGVCAIGCGKTPGAGDYGVVLISIFAFSYMGGVFASLINGMSFWMKEQNAITLGYIGMIAAAFLSMRGSDFLGRYPVLMYADPITSMSMADSGDIRIIVDGMGVCILGYLMLSFILASFTLKKEFTT